MGKLNLDLFLSFGLGFIAVLIWCAVLVPPLFAPRSPSKCNGFLVLWLLADTANLAGCFLSEDFPVVQRIIATVFLFTTLANTFLNYFPSWTASRRLSNVLLAGFKTYGSTWKSRSDRPDRTERSSPSAIAALPPPPPLSRASSQSSIHSTRGHGHGGTRVSSGWWAVWVMGVIIIGAIVLVVHRTVVFRTSVVGSPVTEPLPIRDTTQTEPSRVVARGLPAASTPIIHESEDLWRSVDSFESEAYSGRREEPRDESAHFRDDDEVFEDHTETPADVRREQTIHEHKHGGTTEERIVTKTSIITTHRIRDSRMSHQLEEPMDWNEWRDAAGFTLGWVMTLVYFSCRCLVCVSVTRGNNVDLSVGPLAQILPSQPGSQAQSPHSSFSGIKPDIFCLAVIANTCLCASVLLVDHHRSYVFRELPWILDYCFAILQDFGVVAVLLSVTNKSTPKHIQRQRSLSHDSGSDVGSTSPGARSAHSHSSESPPLESPSFSPISSFVQDYRSPSHFSRDQPEGEPYQYEYESSSEIEQHIMSGRTGKSRGRDRTRRSSIKSGMRHSKSQESLPSFTKIDPPQQRHEEGIGEGPDAV